MTDKSRFTDASDPKPQGSCFTCSGFGAYLPGAKAVFCARLRYVRAQPEKGCASWIREPGSDDEGDDPRRWKAIMDEGTL